MGLSYLTGASSARLATAYSVVRVPLTGGEADQYLAALTDVLGLNPDETWRDSNLRRLLNTAIGIVEKYTGLALQPQDVTVTYTGYSGGELPFGPVYEAIPEPVVTPNNSDGSTVTINYGGTSSLTSGPFPLITKEGFYSGTVLYRAGYSALSSAVYAIPEELKDAIVQHAAASSRAEGITGGVPSQYWKTLAAPSRRF